MNIYVENVFEHLGSEFNMNIHDTCLYSISEIIDVYIYSKNNYPYEFKFSTSIKLIDNRIHLKIRILYRNKNTHLWKSFKHYGYRTEDTKYSKMYIKVDYLYAQVAKRERLIMIDKLIYEH